MDVLSIGLGILLGGFVAHLGSELRECLNARKARKKLAANEERFKFKEEIRTMVIGITDRKINLFQNEVMAYIDGKLAEMDKQPETGEEEEHE